MRKIEEVLKHFLSKSKRTIASTLAFAMVFSSTTWAGMNNIFATNVSSTTKATVKVGDANFDEEYDLTDTLIILKIALGIQDAEGDLLTAADVDKTGEVDLSDALLSLKIALGIEPAPTPKRTPIPPPTFTVPPTPTPKTTFQPVTPNALSVVEGKDVTVASDSGELSTGFVENYNGNTGMYAFYDNPNRNEDNGIKVDNPIAGRKDMVQTVQEATSLEAEPGKVNVWTLTGASIDPLPPLSAFPDEIDPRVNETFNDEEVTYTIPKWKSGFTVSFWAKVNQNTKNADPVLTFANDSMVLYVRANGSVKLFSPSDQTNSFNMGSSKITPLGTGGEWTYYTVTFANDWIQVYVNGQENLYETTYLLGSKMKTFNGGFLTRINPINVATKELTYANERNEYYFTKQDASSSIALPRAGWYKNPATGEYEGFDDFCIFHNVRFRGANGNGTLLMDFLTQKGTSMFIGGADTPIDTNARNNFTGGALFSDVKFFDKELTAEQVASNYEYYAKAKKPAEDIAYPGKNPNEKEDSGSEDKKPEGAQKVNLRKNGIGLNATYDADKDIYTFKAPTADEDGLIDGVRLDNPFAAVKGGDQRSYLKETIEEGLKGQSIFPYKYPDDYEDETLAGKFVAKSQNSDDWTGHGGCDRFAIEPHYGNFYDKYYGDVYKYGTEMKTPTGNLALGTILPEEEVKTTYADEVTTYQRPRWKEGATLSFWAKPTKVDDSPLVTFYAPNKMLLTVDTMGSVCYMSLYTTNNQTNAGDWKEGKTMKAGGEPRNTFATYGDSSYIHENEWNYYTITFANDWVQVYVNGEEMVYKKVNLNRNETKYFNSCYMTRYNPTGIWTKEMIAKYGEPTGKTLEGKDRNYLIKSGYIWDESAGYEIEGVNKSADSAAVRANNVYENPFAGHTGSEMLMTLMTENGSKMYLGGISKALEAVNQFTFSAMTIPMEDIGVENVRCKPISYVKENVLQGNELEQLPIYVDKDVVAVTADTEGAVLLSGVKDWQGNDIYVSEACNVVPANADGSAPTGSFTLGRNTDKEDTNSRRKLYTSDHSLSEGTQISGVEAYYDELSAEEVKELYNSKASSAPAN